MSEKIIIIGSSGAIGSAFVDFYKSQNPNNFIYSLSRSNPENDVENNKNFFIDFENETSISEAAAFCSSDGPFDKVIIATGILHQDEINPEKSYRGLQKNNMDKIFSINTFGPTIAARYFIPLLRKDEKSFLGLLSARVGSISDNKIGGWYSYRSSKAALNMIIKSLSIEVARNNKNLIIAGLHPGTVDSNLSSPFQSNVPDGKLFTPKYSVECLAKVIDNLEQKDSGNIFAWDGQKIDF